MRTLDEKLARRAQLTRTARAILDDVTNGRISARYALDLLNLKTIEDLDEMLEAHGFAPTGL